MKIEDPTIAGLLRPLGYATGQFGKNHLGDRDEMLPMNNGFDQFFGNLNAEEEPENPDYPQSAGFEGPIRPARGDRRQHHRDVLQRQQRRDFTWPVGGTAMFRGEKKHPVWEGGIAVPTLISAGRASWSPESVINDIAAHEEYANHPARRSRRARNEGGVAC